MTRLHWVGAALVFLGSTAAGFALRQELRLRLRLLTACLLYTSPSPRDRQKSRMPSSA